MAAWTPGLHICVLSTVQIHDVDFEKNPSNIQLFRNTEGQSLLDSVIQADEYS